MTLFVREVHRVVGTQEAAFEAAYRDVGGWMDRLGRDDDARLLGYFHHAHGTGPSYRVITITAVRDGAAWERLARRTHGGDLSDLTRSTDELRHDARAKLLLPAPFSPLVDVDLAGIPSTGSDHEPALFMEDTMWPERGQLDAYLDGAAAQYVPLLQREESLLRLDAALVTALGGGRSPEVVLLQAVKRPDALVGLLADEPAAAHRRPGSWMHDALAWRDQWESRILRSARWSPLW